MRDISIYDVRTQNWREGRETSERDAICRNNIPDTVMNSSGRRAAGYCTCVQCFPVVRSMDTKFCINYCDVVFISSYVHEKHMCPGKKRSLLSCVSFILWS